MPIPKQSSPQTRRTTSRAHATSPVFSTDPTVDQLVRDRLTVSGLSVADGHALKLKGRTAAETAALDPAFEALPGLVIPYFDPLGASLSDHPSCPQFFRLRYLETLVDPSMLTEKRPIRYMQRPNTLPVAYYPQCYPDWPNVCADPDVPLILTEGEFKAAKTCQMGFPTIGLGGVHNFKSRKHGIDWLDSLTHVIWERRNVYIVFDSDVKTNPDVSLAVARLTEALCQRGAFPHVAILAEIEPGKKIGLDDFFVAKNGSGVEEFEKILKMAQPLSRARVLFSFNDTYALVHTPTLVIDVATKEKYNLKDFHTVEGQKQYEDVAMKPDGELKYETVAASEAWMKWPVRRDVKGLTYKPLPPGTQSQIIVKDNGLTYCNLWKKWGVEPRAGDHDLFLELVTHMFTGSPPEDMKWFLQWCAYPLQYPGTKLFSSAVIYGTEQGTGKSLLGTTLGTIYGENFTEVKQRDLMSSFNEWTDGKQFVMAEEVVGSDKRHEGDVLKNLITQRQLRINMKYIPSYVVEDCINYYFTSNHPDAFFLEDTDRRFFIHEVTVKPKPAAFYAHYMPWLDTGGAEAVFHYLLHLDLSDFNPAAPARRTQAKETMIADGQSDLGSWVRMLRSSPDAMLKMGQMVFTKDCYTTKELLGFYDPAGSTKTTANGLARELRRAGVPQAFNGAPVRTPDGLQQRYFIIRNVEKWTKTTVKEFVTHVTQPMSPEKPPAKY